MRLSQNIIALFTGCLLLSACANTTVSRSWKSPDFTAHINKTYIIGISKDELKRRVFEDSFSEKLSKYGVQGVASYKDLPQSKETDKTAIARKVKINNVDSVLMVRIINERTEQVVTPARISSTTTAPNYSDRYNRNRDYRPADHYYDYGSYYSRSTETVYEPSRVTDIKIETIEANLYDAKSAKMVWSAQLELFVDGSADRLLKDFINTAVADMRSKGLF